MRGPVSRDTVQLARLWFLASVSSLILAPFLFRFAAVGLVCPLHAMTGVPCPTCGSTRALVALGQFHPWEAFLWNPLVTLGAFLFLIGGLLAPLWVGRGGRLPRHAGTAPVWFRLGVPALLVVNWVYLVVVGV